jgi:long-subunit fatty acid transport protein
LNVYSGKVQRNSNSIGIAPGIPINNFQQGFGTIYQNQIDSNSFSGFNVTVGLKLDGEKLDAGLVVRTPFSLNQKSEEVSVEIVDLNGVAFATDTTFRIDLLTKYDIPLMVGLGVGYQYRENWLFAVDMEFRKFNSANIKIRENLILVPGGNNIEEFRILDNSRWQWSNVFIVRAGTEYLKKTSIGTIPLRAGLGYVPLPTPNVDVNGIRSTSVSYQFSLGTGIHWNQIKLDLGYMYRTYNLESSGFIAEEKAQNHFLNASFTGYF